MDSSLESSDEKKSAQSTHLEEHERNRYVALLVKILRFIAAQWLVIGFGIACLVAHYAPSVAAYGGPIRSEYTIVYGGVAFIFLVSGLQLSPEKLAKNATNWRLHVVVQGMSFVVIPAIVLAVIYISIAAGALHSGVPSIPIMAGMLVVACIPTTIASNVVMTRTAGGDDAAAVISVVVGNVVGSFLAPILIYGYLPTNKAFDAWRPAGPSTLGQMYAEVAKRMGLTVLLPLLVGQIVRRTWNDKTVWVIERFMLAKASTCCLILLMWTTFSNTFKTGAIYDLSPGSVAFLVLMNIALYLLYTLFCFFAARPPMTLIRVVNRHVADSSFAQRHLPSWLRRPLRLAQMSREQTVAVCFCGAAKTAGVGIPLITAMWDQTDAKTRAFIMIPVVLYTGEQVLVAQMFTYVFRWYLRRGRNDSDDENTLAGSDAEK